LRNGEGGGGGSCRTPSRPRQFPFDRGNNKWIGRLHRRTEARLQVAVAPDQVFAEIPARPLERPLGCRPFVKRMGVLALHGHLFRDRKGDVVLALGGGVDVAYASRLLAAKIVGRHAENSQPLVAVSRPQGL